MNFLPKDWNVVVAAAWNPAILTPNGISKRLFGLEEGTPIRLELAIDNPGEFRAFHNDIMVKPTLGKLEVFPISSNIEGLKNAIAIAQKAIEALPETPFVAAGINFRYQLEDISPEFIDLLKAPIDDALSDQHYFQSKSIQIRTLAFEDGVINFQLEQKQDDKYELLLNYHKPSKNGAELIEWANKADSFEANNQNLLALLNI